MRVSFHHVALSCALMTAACLQAKASDVLVQRTCANAVLKHHPRILTTKMENGRTGFCSFTAVLPPELANSAFSETVEGLKAAWAATTTEEFEKVVSAKFGPSIQSAFIQVLSETEGTGSFKAVLEKNSESVTACARAAVMKETFTYGNVDVLQLSCALDFESGNYSFTAVHNDYRVEIALPAG